MSFKIAAAFLASAAAGTALFVTQQPIGASNASVDVLNSQHPKQKLPIYDTAVLPATLLPMSSPLQSEVRQARESFQTYWQVARTHSQMGVDSLLGWEGKAEQKMKETLPADEPLSPGVLYVGVATLAGSILGRNRSILLRAALPPTFLLLSLNYFLPKTANALHVSTSHLENLEAIQVVRKQLVAWRGY